MAFDYAEIAALSLELLTEFGQDVTRVAYTAGTGGDAYDPSTGITTPSTVNTTRKGAIFSFGEGETYVRGNQVKVSDQRLLVDAEATVNLKDHFIVDSVEYTIISIDEISPAGTAVLYDLHIRKD